MLKHYVTLAIVKRLSPFYHAFARFQRGYYCVYGATSVGLDHLVSPLLQAVLLILLYCRDDSRSQPYSLLLDSHMHLFDCHVITPTYRSTISITFGSIHDGLSLMIQ